MGAATGVAGGGRSRLANVAEALEAGVQVLTEGMVVAVEFVAVLIIVWAALQAGWGVIGHVRARAGGMQGIARIRIRLGRWLSLALEFTLAGDILRTVVAPSWDDIGKVAAIAVIRTAINYFLERDIAHLQRRTAEGEAFARESELPG